MKPIRALPRIHASSPYICTNCRLSQTRRSEPSKVSRNYSTSQAASSLPPPPPATGYALLSSRRLISLSGPDSTKYLQGVISANISPTKPRRSGFYAAFLNAQGRLLNDVFIYPDLRHMGAGAEGGKYKGAGDGWLIEVDAKEVDVLAKHVRKYRVSAKFDIRVIGEDEMSVWSVWDESKGKEEGWTAHSMTTHESSISTTECAHEDELGCADSRAPGMGRRIILPTTFKPDFQTKESDESAYTIRRYLKGVAEGQDELLREHALPQESNLDFMGGVDYRKGCYVGQELTIRTHHTGVIRKRILPMMVYSPSDPIPSKLEYNPESTAASLVGDIPRETGIGRVEKKGRSAGKWLNGIGNLGLGLCRLEIMTGVTVGTGGEGGGAFKDGDEFKVEWVGDGEEKKMVKVKAFVPAWHLRQ